MWEWLTSIFNTDGFPARWNCGSAWQQEPGWGWTYIIADLMIWSAYMAIPIVLVYFVRKRSDVPFPKIFWLFSAFIFACGTTHLLDAMVFWWPAYRFAAILEMLTAIISWITVITLIPVLPRALHLPSPAYLEECVRARTVELTELNNQLQNEIAARNRMQEQAESANRAKSDFLANMSHEIRTPLTVVLGCAEILYPHLNNDEKRGMVQMIRNQGELLLGILNDILDLSKIEAGKLEIISQPCSIVHIVEDAKTLFMPQAIDKGITLAANYPQSLPKSLTSDGLRIRQILNNLVGNSLKFTEAGSVNINVSLIVDNAQNYVRIEVNDTGVGVSPEKLRDIFTAFHQEHRHLSQKYGGTGLGLTICQRLIQLLHGKIEISSTEGLGTSIAFFLPITSSEITKQELVVKQIDAQNQEHIHESLQINVPIRILLAEDMRSIQFLLRRMLEDIKATVTIVSNGQEAINAVSNYAPGKEPFDLILMDMQMPVLNGFDATSRLRGLGYTLPIIALTAAALQGDRERCLKVGCNDYLSKPIDRHKLFVIVANHYEFMQSQSSI